MADAKFPVNKTTGKAVADVRGLFLLKHTDGEPDIVSSLSSGNWFPVLTLRGTVNASQDAPSIENINVDQFDAPIGITTEPGSFNFEATLPGLMQEDLIQWLGTYSAETNPSGVVVDATNTIDGKAIYGFNLDGELYDVSVMIQTRSDQAIIFSHAQMTLTFAQDNKTFVLKLSGQILAPTNEKNKMLYLATAKAAQE